MSKLGKVIRLFPGTVARAQRPSGGEICVWCGGAPSRGEQGVVYCCSNAELEAQREHLEELVNVLDTELRSPPEDSHQRALLILLRSRALAVLSEPRAV